MATCKHPQPESCGNTEDIVFHRSCILFVTLVQRLKLKPFFRWPPMQNTSLRFSYRPHPADSSWRPRLSRTVLVMHITVVTNHN